MTEHHDATAVNPLLREVHAAHAQFLNDVHACQTLVDSASSVGTDSRLPRLAALRQMSILIRTRQEVLAFCSLLRDHHALEETLVLPPIAAAASNLAGLIECLRADHRELENTLARIETTVLMVDGPGDASMTLAHLGVALKDLEELLVRHFDHEEEVLGPVIESWQSWPSPHPR